MQLAEPPSPSPLPLSSPPPARAFLSPAQALPRKSLIGPGLCAQGTISRFESRRAPRLGVKDALRGRAGGSRHSFCPSKGAPGGKTRGLGGDPPVGARRERASIVMCFSTLALTRRDAARLVGSPRRVTHLTDVSLFFFVPREGDSGALPRGTPCLSLETPSRVPLPRFAAAAWGCRPSCAVCHPARAPRTQPPRSPPSRDPHVLSPHQ